MMYTGDQLSASPSGFALLPTRTVEKPWGRDALPAPFVAPDGKRIGEIWFEPPAAIPDLLVKYIFASENLSVQVHPSDDQTQAMGLGAQGKEECWLVIAADPGATLGIGFDRPCDPEMMRRAAIDGSIIDLMTWHPVRAGDFFYIPANTVHAIGGGVSLIEVQQNSDITYRLYDYGRGRDLHLDVGMTVADGSVYRDGLHRHLSETGHVRLVVGPYFRLDRVDATVDPATLHHFAAAPVLVVPIAEGVRVDGQPIAQGECAMARSLGQITLDTGGAALIAQSCATKAP